MARSLASITRGRGPRALSPGLDLIGEIGSSFRPSSPQLQNAVFTPIINAKSSESSPPNRGLRKPVPLRASRHTLEPGPLFPPVEVENVALAPQLVDSMHEELSSGKNVFESRPLGTTRTSVVFGVASDPAVVVKYQVQCTSLPGALHPLVREYYFLNKLKTLGIAPVPIVVSESAELPEEPSAKTQFLMTSEERRACREKGSYVRFMAMERVGVSLFQLSLMFHEGMVPANLAISLTIQTITNLQILHEQARMVHNDLHWGNVALPNRVVKDPRVFLLDFGRSFAITGGRLPSLFRIPFDSAVAHSSPWEIAGYHPGPRDDVFRALFMMVGLIGGKKYMQYHGALAEFPEKSFDAKISEFQLLSPVKGWISESQYSSILEALKYVLRLPHSSAKVDYRFLLHTLGGRPDI